MAAKSTADQYGTVAVTLHWLSALLIIALIGSGFRADGAEDVVSKTGLLRVHVPLGIAILLLTLGRIGWWKFADKKPTPLPGPTWQDRGARAVHVLFYVVILGMAASGIGMLILSGAGPIIFGADATTLPDFWEYNPRTPHGIGARVVVALLVLHTGAALHHHLFQERQTATTYVVYQVTALGWSQLVRSGTQWSVVMELSQAFGSHPEGYRLYSRV